MISNALNYARQNWLEVSIFAMVIFTYVWVTWLNTPPKVTVAIGLTVFAVAGTLAFLMFREVYRDAHPIA